MSSYTTYRDRDRDWDEPRSSVSIKRYVIPPEDDRDRNVVLRRPLDDWDDRSGLVSRYEPEDDPYRYGDYYEREYSEPYGIRHYVPSGHYLDLPPVPIIIPQGQPVIIHEARGPVYVHPRESDYVDRDPSYYYHRRLRRELSPGDSISQAPRRHYDDRDYNSEDSRDYDERPHHRRHMAEGALVGVGAAELLRNRRKNEGDDVSNGAGRVGRDVGAGALGAVAVEAASRAKDYYRSRSRHRSHSSYDDDRDSRHHRHRHRRHRHSHGGRSRSRARSHSRGKTWAGVGLGAAAIAALALAKNNHHSNDDRRSRSRHRRASSSRRSERKDEGDDHRSGSHKKKHMAGAGLAGAAAAGFLNRAYSRSRSRGGSRSRSHSKVRKALPVVAGGLGTAAATGLYEKNKDKKEESRSRHRERPRRSRSQSRPPSGVYPDPSRDSAGLIEYGDHPVHGNIPAADYYGRPPTPPGYYSDASDPVASGAAGYGRSRNRSRSRSRDRFSDSSSGSGSVSPRRSGSRPGRRNASIDRDRPRFEDEVHDPYASHDPYAEPYMPHPPSPLPARPPMNNHPYPDPHYGPPAPGPGPRPGNGRPYHPADYPPPPGAGPPPQPYGYPPPPGPEPYAPRPRKAEQNVSTAPKETYNGLRGIYTPPQTPRSERRKSRTSQSPPPKTVSFDLDSPPQNRHVEPGYETDASDSSDSMRHGRQQSSPGHHSTKTRDARQNKNESRPSPDRSPESDSDSTIDLPERFDSHGRLLPEKESEPTSRLEDFINGMNHVFT